jgi:protoporphyrinogen oxidase
LDREIAPLVIESCASVGGLTRSIFVDEFCFDYTGHLLHLSRHQSPAALPYASQSDSDWQTIERRSFCLFEGHLVPAPIQYHLGSLPEPYRSRCIRSYRQRPQLSASESSSFRDYLVAGFGDYLSDAFLIPLNEKTLATSMSRLSMKAVRRFFPPPDERVITAGMRESNARAPEYNSSFWYPRRGGIGHLIDGLARPIKGIRILEPVVHVDVNNKVLVTSGGACYTWDLLFSSIPLRSLCTISNLPELAVPGASLTNSSTLCFNFGIRGPVPPALERVHWVYVADPSIPFYRVGVYSNISTGACPPGYHSFYVEVGAPGDQIESTNAAGSLQAEVLASLAMLGWVQPAMVSCATINRIPCAYVHHTLDRDDTVSRLLALLRRCDIYCIGRYGLWDYTSMEDSLLSGIQAVTEAFS